MTNSLRADSTRRLLPILIGQAFGLACGVIGVRLTSTLVPAATLGPYSIFLTFASVGMWAVHAGVIAFTARHWAQTADHPSLLRRIALLGARKLPWLLLGCAMGALVIDGPSRWILFLLLAVSAPLLSAATIAQTALQAARESWRDSGVLAAAAVSRSFFPPLLFAASGGQALALYAGYGLHAMVFAGAGLWALAGALCRSAPAVPDVTPVPGAYEGSLFIVLAAAGWVLLGLGRWLMAFFYGPTQTGYFSLASSLATLAPAVLGTISLMYFQPGFFASRMNTRDARERLARRVDGVALGHAAATVAALVILRLITPWLIGPLIDTAYAPAVDFLIPAGCFMLAVTTGQFYRSLLLAGKREAACGPVELTAAAVLIAGSVATAAIGQDWFLRWMTLSPLVPWAVNRPFARKYFLSAG